MNVTFDQASSEVVLKLEGAPELLKEEEQGVTAVASRTAVTTYLDIAHAPEVQGTYTIAPDYMIITRTEGVFYCVEVWGRRVRKDGTLGKLRYTAAWSAANSRGIIPGAPSWVQELVHEYMPSLEPRS